MRDTHETKESFERGNPMVGLIKVILDEELDDATNSGSVLAVEGLTELVQP